MAPVCRFWSRGNCREGDSCRFEHPGSKNQTSDRNTNRFAQLSSDRAGSGSRGPVSRRDLQAKFNLDPEIIRIDLSDERPEWILSCYGPGRNAPAQLFGGLPREQSFEEMRLRHYELAANGKTQEATTEAQSLAETASQQMQVALQDINGAIEFICSAENQHPNRIDICKDSVRQGSGGGFGFPASQRSGPPHQAGMSFGQPSAPNTSSGPFGTSRPAFGNHPPSQTSFGQPSTGINSSGASAFPSSANPFGRAADTSRVNPFARATGGFASSAPAGVASGFGQQSNTPLNNGTPAFGVKSSNEPAAHSSFANGGHSQPPRGNPFSSGAEKNSSRDASGSLRTWEGKPVSYPDDNGEPCVRRPDGQWEKIWFPDGPPVRNMAQEIPFEHYDDNLENDYRYLKDNNKFKNGVIPSFPPKWDWTSWDF